MYMNVKYFDKTNIHFNTPPSITIYKYLKLTAVYLNKQVHVNVLIVYSIVITGMLKSTV